MNKLCPVCGGKLKQCTFRLLFGSWGWWCTKCSRAYLRDGETQIVAAHVEDGYIPASADNKPVRPKLARQKHKKVDGVALRQSWVVRGLRGAIEFWVETDANQDITFDAGVDIHVKESFGGILAVHGNCPFLTETCYRGTHASLGRRLWLEYIRDDKDDQERLWKRLESVYRSWL